MICTQQPDLLSVYCSRSDQLEGSNHKGSFQRFLSSIMRDEINFFKITFKSSSMLSQPPSRFKLAWLSTVAWPTRATRGYCIIVFILDSNWIITNGSEIFSQCQFYIIYVGQTKSTRVNSEPPSYFTVRKTCQKCQKSQCWEYISIDTRQSKLSCVKTHNCTL